MHKYFHIATENNAYFWSLYAVLPRWNPGLSMIGLSFNQFLLGYWTVLYTTQIMFALQYFIVSTI